MPSFLKGFLGYQHQTHKGQDAQAAVQRGVVGFLVARQAMPRWMMRRRPGLPAGERWEST